MPPWPGMRAPESLAPAARLRSDSARSPDCAATAIIGPRASAARGGEDAAQRHQDRGLAQAVAEEPAPADHDERDRRPEQGLAEDPGALQEGERFACRERRDGPDEQSQPGPPEQ